MGSLHIPMWWVEGGGIQKLPFLVSHPYDWTWEGERLWPFLGMGN